MVSASVVLLLGVLSQVIVAQFLPSLSETFSSTLKITVSDEDDDYIGTGVWAKNKAYGKSLLSYTTTNSIYNVLNLQRFDLELAYELRAENTSVCDAYEVEGTISDEWAWLALTTFVGNEGSGATQLDIWEAPLGYATMTIAVYSTNITRPVYMIRKDRDDIEIRFDFVTWSTVAPSNSTFNVPTKCASAQPTDEDDSDVDARACVSRDTMITRARKWWTAGVQYNQGRTYGGYRTDCSGYVSMAWKTSKPGYVTQTLHRISKRIAKSSLKKGDILLYAAQHVVIFAGWANTAHTKYHAYEMANSREDCKYRVTPYPYWHNTASYKPYRYNKVC